MTAHRIRAARAALAFTLALLGARAAEARQKFNSSQDNVLYDVRSALADVDGNGTMELVSWGGASGTNNTFYVRSAANINTFGVAHYYTGPDVISTVFIGRFGGGTQDQICYVTGVGSAATTSCLRLVAGTRRLQVITSQATNAYWPVTSTTKFIAGNFDGDAGATDELLVYDTATGSMTFWGKATATGNWSAAAITLGNLGSANRVNGRVLVGQFGQDGADDILFQDSTGNIARYDAVNSGGRTFWWAWNTGGGFVGTNQRAHVARCTSAATDCIVLNNVSTGGWSFYDLNHGVITNVTSGNLPTNGVRAVFAELTTVSGELGGTTRDDAIVYNSGHYENHTARYAGSQFTYWYFFPIADVSAGTFSVGPTNGIPLNVIDCRDSTLTTVDNFPPNFRTNVFSSAPAQRNDHNLFDLWLESTFGQSWPAPTFYGPVSVVGLKNYTTNETRGMQATACVTGAHLTWSNTAHYVNFMGQTPYGVGGGSAAVISGAPPYGGAALMNWSPASDGGQNADVLGEEIWHTLGVNHGLDSLYTEYGDNTDFIDSANVWSFSTSGFGRSGPLLGPGNVLHTTGVSLPLPTARNVTYNKATPATVRAAVTITAWNRPETPQPLLVQLSHPSPGSNLGLAGLDYTYATLRIAEDYDQGLSVALPTSTVLIQGWDDESTPNAIGPNCQALPCVARGRRQFILAALTATAGSNTYRDALHGVTITVNSIDASNGVANLTVTF